MTSSELSQRASPPPTSAHLRRSTVALPGTVDSSPIYLHGASVDGAMPRHVVVTTTYGRTIAIDADSGRILWTFTPPGLAQLGGQRADHHRQPDRRPDRQFVYAASPNGLIHKLSIADGREERRLAGARSRATPHARRSPRR